MRGNKIWLIFLLPFLLNLSIVSLASSEVEMNLSISGSDGIEGVRKGSDSVIFLMNFSGVPATELPEDSIMINDDPVSEDYLTCLSQASGVFNCAYTTPGFVANTPYHDYKVELVIGNVLASKTKRVYVDKLGPVIESVEGLQDVINRDKSYNIEVALEDRSFDSSPFCSGLDRIEIFMDNNLIKEETIESDDCYLEKTISLTGKELSTGKLCIYAYDKLNQPSEPFCQDIFVDSEAPVIEGFNLFYNDEPIRYLMKDKSYSVVPKANISENGDLSPGNVHGNFSSINPSYSNLQASSCEKISEEMYECKWQPLTISLSEQKTFNIKIKAVDEAGYESTKDFSVTILIDAEGPSVGTIYSAYGKYGNVNYIAEKSTIILEINDKESGISANNVYIDASGIMAGSKIEADFCENGKCYFSDVISGLDHLEQGEIKVHPDTKDNAGNSYEGYKSEFFIMDREAPEFHNVSITNREGGEGLSGGDTMTITVYASDDTRLFIGGNFSKVSNDDVEETACAQTSEANLWRCSIDVGDLIAGFDDEVEYYVRDFTNNSFKKTAKVHVNFPLSIQNPDFWELKDAEVLGTGIDAEAISQVSQTVIVNIELDANAADIKLSDMKLSCRGTNFESVSVMLPNQAENSIVVPVLFQVGKSTVDEPIDVSCTAELYTEVGGNFLTVYSEKEIIEFKIPIFESSMGVSTDVMTEKVKSQVEFINSLLGVAEFANNFFEISKTICEAITGVSGAVSLINTIIEPLKDILPAIPSLSLDKTAVSTAKADNALVSALGKFCSFATCSHNKTIPISIELPNVLEEYDIYGFETPQPGESIVYDVYTLCLPGVVSGLYEMLEIECGRLVCYGTALESGAPISYCDQITSYAYCNDVLGDVFAALPLTHTWRELGGAFRDFFSNPISFVGGIVSYACSPASLIPSAHTTLASVCRVTTLAGQYLELGNMLLSAYDWIADLFDETEETESYCRQVVNEYSEYLDD
ncbi:MAG: hypothetical protein PWR30_505 [Candidatus Woesearchaeota archaeon]|nr:hypothetical protein [Candidatus Woesearchaeota archaeon]